MTNEEAEARDRVVAALRVVAAIRAEDIELIKAEDRQTGYEVAKARHAAVYALSWVERGKGGARETPVGPTLDVASGSRLDALALELFELERELGETDEGLRARCGESRYLQREQARLAALLAGEMTEEEGERVMREAVVELRRGMG